MGWTQIKLMDLKPTVGGDTGCGCSQCFKKYHEKLSHWADLVVNSDVQITASFLQRLDRRGREELVKAICLRAARR